MQGGSDNNTTIFSEIQYITISSDGNAQDFGDLSGNLINLGSCSSTTRGIFSGGSPSGYPNSLNSIQFVTMSTLSNTSDFGDLKFQVMEHCGLSNSTRGVFNDGERTDLTTSGYMQYITMASEGNYSDFGSDLVNRANSASVASPTRGIFAWKSSSFGFLL